MPDPPDVPDWQALEPWLDDLGLAGAVPLRRIGDESGAYSPAGRWIVERPDGARRFVKAMRPRDPGGADPGLEREALACGAQVDVAMPHVDAWSYGAASLGRPSLLVLEDLSDAHWGVPVTASHARALREALDLVAGAAPPSALPTIGDDGGWPSRGWSPLLERGLAGFESLGLAHPGWLDRHADALTGAASAADRRGDRIVHGDLWRQNWCIRTSGDATIVDWSGARVGAAAVNAAWAECGIRAAGGPHGVAFAPEEDGHAAWAAWMCGIACSFVTLDEFDRTRHHRLHRTQLREAAAALHWASDALGIEPPRPRAGALPPGPWEP